jgi:CheY-like chemotaxis protein
VKEILDVMDQEALPPQRFSLARELSRGERFEQLADVAVALHELARAITSLRRLAQDGSQQRVLLVHADPGLRADLSQLLRAAQHYVTEAAGFADALVQLASGAFDAVITDEQLGGAGSGRMLLAEVRDRWPFVRRVLCTARHADLTEALDPSVVQRLLVLPVEEQLLRASLL